MLTFQLDGISYRNSPLWNQLTFLENLPSSCLKLRASRWEHSEVRRASQYPHRRPEIPAYWRASWADCCWRTGRSSCDCPWLSPREADTGSLRSDPKPGHSPLPTVPRGSPEMWSRWSCRWPQEWDSGYPLLGRGPDDCATRGNGSASLRALECSIVFQWTVLEYRDC